MTPENADLLKAIIGSVGVLGMLTALAILIFRTGRIVQNLENLTVTLAQLETKVDVGFKDVDTRSSR